MAETVAGPTFGKTASYISDVQFRHSLSPDNRILSIHFDNLLVGIMPGGPPACSRTFTIVYPLVDAASEMELSIDFRGAVLPKTGVTGNLALLVLGQTRVLDPILDSDDAGSYTKSLRIRVPAGRSDLPMTFVLSVEQSDNKQPGQALLTVDSVDLALGAAEGEE
jgi:hypothetical protein